jgi:L,D-peptidoglycan transpeptidase YkuD (ErfK/YbiS/YcfS/YnhG family)
MIFRASQQGLFQFDTITSRCVLGKGGVRPAAEKREGDGASPLGVWPLRRVWHRADRLERPETGLSVRRIAPEDGWCDGPGDPAYNRAVLLPYPASAERMWRDDHVYDLVVELGYNDDPVVGGAGSAIFWHLAQPDWRATEGCVAVSLETMLLALRAARPGDAVEITD